MYANPTSPPMTQGPNAVPAALPSRHSGSHETYGYQDHQSGYNSNDGYPSDYHQQPYSDAPAPVWGSGYTGAAAAGASSTHSHSNSAGAASYWDDQNRRYSNGGAGGSQHFYQDHPPSQSPSSSSHPQSSGGPMTPLQSAAAAKAAEAGLHESASPRHSRQLSSHSGVVVHQDAGRPLPATGSASAEGGSDEAPPPSYQ